MAWGGVWGSSNAANAVGTLKKAANEDEECFICANNVAATVLLKPCGHKFCPVCVSNMRAKNIFRKDAVSSALSVCDTVFLCGS